MVDKIVGFEELVVNDTVGTIKSELTDNCNAVELPFQTKSIAEDHGISISIVTNSLVVGVTTIVYTVELT
jgi:hypothetical protein